MTARGPTDLDDLQRFLASTFQRSESVTADPDLVVACSLHVAGNERVSPAEQVDIYRRQFWLKHRGCLAEDYPGLVYIIGDEAFDRLCRAYLEAYPPSSPSLRDLGQHIVAFSQGYEDFEPKRAGLARDMIRYENAFIDVFDAREPDPLDPTKVTRVPPEGWDVARIVLHPHLVRMRFDHPVHQIRAAVKKGQEPKLSSKPEPSPLYVALYRRDLVIHFATIAPEAYRLLDLLDRGVPLTAACERVAEGLDAAATAELSERIGRWFQQWARDGWFVDVLYPPPNEDGR